MGSFINQHSFVISALVLWGGLALLLLRKGLRRRGVLALIAVGGAFGLVWLGLRPGAGTLSEAAEVEAVVGRGQPVLVEFYSNY